MFEDSNKKMEVYFSKEFIFPYMFLDEIEKSHMEYSDTNIYMIMLQNRLEIIEAKFHKGVLNIKYRDLIMKEMFNIDNILLFPFYISDESLNISIINFGIAIEVSIDSKGIDYIERNYPEFSQEREFDKSIKLQIYDIVSWSKSQEITKGEYEILYIGQSNPKDEYKTIYNRLKRHEKILEVYRNYNLEYQNRELMILVLKATSKLHNIYKNLVLSSSKWQTFDTVGEKISDDSIIDLTEAMLIYHFKPKYNIRLKDAIPNIKLKTYENVVRANIDSIEIGINLFFSGCKDRIVLFTETQYIDSLLRILRCNLNELYEKNENARIIPVDIEDWEYCLLFGEVDS